MNSAPNWQSIAKQIEKAISRPFIITNIQEVSSGCINSAYVLASKDLQFFIKLNQAHLASMFEAEFLGLIEISQTNTLKVPCPILFGSTAEHAFLVLEFTKLYPRNQQSDAQLGHQLAALHQIKQPFFGWQQNNTIGSTPQPNQKSNHWLTFWQTQRLNFQLSQAKQQGYNGHLIDSGEKLSASLDYFLDDCSISPSLLHGDLWSGNAAMTKQGDAIIYDPACYYGDRAADIAMTELFSGFSDHFYAAYNESYPLSSTYPTLKMLYNLYHILNHLNLFGASYQQQAQNMIDSLLSEIY